MEPSNNYKINNGGTDRIHTMDGKKMSAWPSHAHGQSQIRRAARRVLSNTKTGSAGRIERQQQRIRVPVNRHERAVTAIIAATMLALLPFRKPLGSLDARFAKHILLPNRQPKMDESPFSIGFRPSSPTESRLPRDREDPCSFRTRLLDPMADLDDADMAFESTDKLDGGDLRFDDTQCISVGRSMGKLGAMLAVTALPSDEKEHANEGGIANELPRSLDSTPTYKYTPDKYEQAKAAGYWPGTTTVIRLPGEPQGATVIQQALSDVTTYRTVLVSDNDSDEDHEGDVNNMETMNMPFWTLPPRQKRQHARHASDTIPDDMSIISDVSLIPTYFPSDAMKQQRPQHRTLVKRLIRAKARAARQTMRELKRSCRDAVGNVFVESGSATRPPKCVAVGSAF